jgi:hypothetical protein
MHSLCYVHWTSRGVSHYNSQNNNNKSCTHLKWIACDDKLLLATYSLVPKLAFILPSRVFIHHSMDMVKYELYEEEENGRMMK